MVGEKLEERERKMKFLGRVFIFVCFLWFDLVVVIVFVDIFEF